MLDALQNGYNITNHIDHCDTTVIGAGPDFITITDINNLTNAPKFAVWWTCGCYPADFEYDDCIAEHCILNPNGGMVSFCGNSRYGWVGYADSQLDPEFYVSLFQDDLYHIGETLLDSKATFVPPADNVMRYCIYELNLFGCPEMTIITDTPENLVVTHPNTIGMLIPTNVTVTVYKNGNPVAGARVAISRVDAPDDYWTGLTAANGSVTLSNVTVSQEGDYDIVVTAHNGLPYEGIITSESEPPAGISNLTALTGNSDGEIFLQWTAPGEDGTVGTVSGYLVKYATSQINNLDFYASWVSTYTHSWTGFSTAGSEESRLLTGLTPGVTLYFALKAYDIAEFYGVWNSSIDVPGINTANYAPVQELVPPAPTNLSSIPYSTEIYLIWTAPSPYPTDFDYYRVYCDSTTPYDWVDSFIATETINSSFLHIGLTNYNTYYYRVTTVDQEPMVLESSYSNEVSTAPYLCAPFAPTNFVGFALSTTAIQWAWEDNSSSEDGFRIYTATDGLIAEVSTNTINWTQNGLNPNTSSYIYSICSFNSYGESNKISLSVYPVYSLANPPTGSSVVSVSSVTITIQWSANSNPAYTRWGIVRSTESGFTSVTTLKAFADNYISTSYFASDLLPLTSYWFKVSAFNEDGVATVFDQTVSTKTPPAPPAPPPPPDNNPPTLSWTGEANYISDGLNPIIGTSTNTYIYRVKYTDADNDAPYSGYPRVHIKKGGAEITGSPFTMTAADSNSYSTGRKYSYSATLSVGTDYTYYFEAQDANGATANHQPPTDVDAPDVIVPTYYIKGYVKMPTGTAINGVTLNLTGVNVKKVAVTNASGYYEFLNLLSGSYTITPNKLIYTFSPVSRSTISLDRNIDNWDFTGIAYITAGEIKIIGGTESKGAVNPNKDESVKIDFKGNSIGKFECKIFMLTGEIVYEETKENISVGRFEWIPKDIASGIYVVYIKGPGVKIHKKMVILR